MSCTLERNRRSSRPTLLSHSAIACRFPPSAAHDLASAAHRHAIKASRSKSVRGVLLHHINARSALLACVVVIVGCIGPVGLRALVCAKLFGKIVLQGHRACGKRLDAFRAIDGTDDKGVVGKTGTRGCLREGSLRQRRRTTIGGGGAGMPKMSRSSLLSRSRLPVSNAIACNDRACGAKQARSTGP